MNPEASLIQVAEMYRAQMITKDKINVLINYIPSYVLSNTQRFASYNSLGCLWYNYLFNNATSIYEAPYNIENRDHFIDNKVAEFMYLMYDVTRKVLYRITKFQRLFRMKYIYKRNDADTDLTGEEWSTMDKREYIDIIENGCVYRFSTRDIYNIVKSGLTNSLYMENKPRHPKNPYTNLRISRKNLYRMMHALLHVSQIYKYSTIPCYMRTYFQYSLSLEHSYYLNRYEMSEAAVKQFVDGESESEVIDYVYDMCYTYEEYVDRQMSIDRTICARSILQQVRTPLITYLLMLRQQDGMMISRLHKKVIRQLLQMLKKNPSFGRKPVSVNSESAENLLLFGRVCNDAPRATYDSLWDNSASLLNNNE